MDDTEIIQLYFARDEGAIEQTDQKYGGFCRRVALNILSIKEDAEECVNDTWLAAWKKIPPERPASLRAFLGRIVRNLSISRWRANHAQKRFAGMEVLLSELDECLPSAQTVEGELDRSALGALLSGWLDTLPREDRVLFVRRYWYGDAVKELAAGRGCTPNQISQKLLRSRKGLRQVLESEGVAL